MMLCRWYAMAATEMQLAPLEGEEVLFRVLADGTLIEGGRLLPISLRAHYAMSGTDVCAMRWRPVLAQDTLSRTCYVMPGTGIGRISAYALCTVRYWPKAHDHVFAMRWLVRA
eukprot:3412780-Rhodomonas_salina.3